MSRTDSKNTGIGIAAIAIAVISIAIAGMSFSGLADVKKDNQVPVTHEEYVPENREIYLFTQVDEAIDEEKFAVPPDMFSQDTIVVMQGDKVKVHFYNLEPSETQENHTFTINDPAYKIHEDVNAESSTVIEFTATEPGVFEYLCTYHQPTMRGELVVLPPS